ncbi:response regulator [Fenollaria massiliensis]|uniref:Stage 0 sporulation protein A homolog n=1 Tax=Fenollaria massiliensis TaxID=938288 RepID=A0A9E7IWI1_9FIRM|nr:response regulator transcription factor [Fenollaria massiliensis]UQK59799.1 response regulator transcription factor [Fenollaria massiliensis]
MKIILLDDHKLFGSSIKLLLEEQDEIEFCDYVSTIDDLFKYLQIKNYDIALLDINLKSEKTGLDLIGEVLEIYPDINVVILTSYDLKNYKETAYKLGVKDFINKSVEIDDLIERLVRVNEGKNKIFNINDKPLLTDSEKIVLKELVKGSNKKDIANKLFISERTLYNHISNIYSKLGVNNAIEAFNKAMELGYIDPLM